MSTITLLVLLSLSINPTQMDEKIQGNKKKGIKIVFHIQDVLSATSQGHFVEWCTAIKNLIES